MDKYIEYNFSKYIKTNVLDTIFPVLNFGDKTFLLEYLIKLIKYIVIKYSLKDNSIIYQFKQNNNRDIQALLFILLPYIDDVYGSKKKRLLSLNDLFVKKDKEGKYIYTNVQYDRCIFNIEDGSFKERKYNREYTIHNYELIKRSIFLSANKSYVNWINILPYTMEDIYKSELYNNTLEMFNEENYREGDSSYEKDENGKIIYSKIHELSNVDLEQCFLPFNDIYNTILNDLFLSVKDMKWLIYETQQQRIPFVILLNSIVNLDTILQEKKWKYLNRIDKEKFSGQWNSLKLQAKNNGDINFLFKNIIAFFQKYYKNISTLIDKKLYKKYSETNINDYNEVDEENKFDDIDINIFYDSVNKTPVEYIYDYLYDTIIRFKNTWYFNNEKEYLTKENRKKFKNINENFYVFIYDTTEDIIKLQDKYISPILLFFDFNYPNKKLFITLKNIYNLSKSITHVLRGELYILRANNYSSIESYKDIDMINLLSIKGKIVKFYKSDNDISLKKKIEGEQEFEKNIEWFNISNNIKNLYKIDNNLFIKKINSWIYYIIKTKFLLKIIFEILVKKGVLSYFKPNMFLTNEKLMPPTYSLKQKYLEKHKKNFFNYKNIEKFNKAYYYLNNRPYSEINENNEYFDKIIYKFNWMTTYAMDWISQINFFHRYIHNRVILVTGSTGVGKSTEIPKLLLYALKAIDYKSNGKIICTQPRIPPTEMVSSRVSDNIGFSIKEKSKIYKKYVPTDNFYIQYKHSATNHIDKNNNYNLKFVTDGTLIKELIESPFCKKTIIKKDKKQFSENNLYDILIVDEAHEHNTNMDIILSLAKHCVYYNNDIKLVIISATMDDDDPIYRRFYRCINDNRKMPLDMHIKDYELDRINVDRRLHISPPGQLTRFRIDEIYETNLSKEQKTWEWAFNRGKERVIEICRKTNDGDILLFVTGVGDIIDAVQYINKITEEYKLHHIVCLPYHGELSEEDKLLVEEIDNKETKRNFTKHKETIENKDVIKNDVPKGTYTRAVIVATNLAEASITINSLKYVVETGYANESLYIYNIRSSIIQKNEISESSRIQRKGRVGRVADGVVYYTYEKNGRVKNKTKYNIINENISNSLYNLLSESVDEKCYFNEIYDMNLYKNVKNNNFKDFYEIFTKFSKKKKLTENIINLFDIFSDNHYTIKGKDNHYIYDYFGVKKHNDYENIIRPIDVLETGYTKETLYDFNGTFYLVHPDSNIRRENDVTGIVKNITIPLKVKDFFSMLEEHLLIINDNRIKRVKHKNIDISHYKTEYGYNLNLLQSSLNTYENEIIPYIYGEKYNCREEVLNIVCLLKACNNNISSLIDNKSHFKNLYANNYGDYIILLKIYKFIKIILKETNIFKDINIDILKKQFNKNKELYDNNIKYDKSKLQRNIDIDNYLKFKKIEYMGTINEYEFYLKDNYKYLLDEIILNSDRIKKYCSAIFINYEIIMRYLKMYIKFKYNIFYNNFKKENNIKEDELEEIIDIDWFDKNTLIYYKTENLYENIILAFMYGYGQNIGKYMGKNMYVDVIQKQILFNENMINSNEKYIMYNVPDNKNFDNNKTTNINIVNNIKLEWLFSIRPFAFNIKKFIRDNYVKSLYYIDNIKTDNKPNYKYYDIAHEALTDFKNDIISNKSQIIKVLNLMSQQKSDENKKKHLKKYFNNLSYNLI